MPAGKEKHTVQYFEMFGNRAIYSDGWYARTIHRAAWKQKPDHPLAEDVWELYHANEHFSLLTNVASCLYLNPHSDGDRCSEKRRDKSSNRA